MPFAIALAPWQLVVFNARCKPWLLQFACDEAVAIVFMLLSSINFALHFFGFRDRSLNAYWRDEEVRALLLIMALSYSSSRGIDL